MFSSRKVLIKAAELAALVGVIACLITAFQVKQGHLDPERVKIFVLPGMILEFGIFSVGFALSAEFKRLQKTSAPPASGKIDLSFKDMKMLLCWCPRAIKLSYVLAVVVAIYTVFSVGLGVSWRSGEAFTEREAVGFPLFGALMLLMLLPVLASAARMPGTYAEHFHPRLRGSNDA